MAVTRNPVLDQILAGNSLGAESISKQIMKKELKLNLALDVRVDDNDEKEDGTVPCYQFLALDHGAFGLPSEMTRARKGQADY